MIDSVEVPLPEPAANSDDVNQIIFDLLGAVPASRWAFARVARSGDLFSFAGSHGHSNGLDRISDELKRQRTASPRGPRIAATLGSLHKRDSGITLVFADACTDLGILTLLRTGELGPFTSREICVLTLALDTVSDALLATGTQPPENNTPSAQRLPAALEEAVRQLMAGRSHDAIRMQPMAGPSDLFIGVRID